MFDWLWNLNNGLLLGALGFVTGIGSLLYSRSQAKGTHAQLDSAREQAIEALRAAELVAENANKQAIEALRAAGLVAESAKQQAIEALRAAGLVAESARLEAIETRRAAGLVADGAREQAVEALRAAGLVAENARLQAEEAVRAAGLVADGAREQAVEVLHAAELVAETSRQQAAEALTAARLVADGAREQALEAVRAAGLVAESARQQAGEALRAAELLANSEVSARVREMRARNFRANPNLPADIQQTMEKAGGADAYSVILDSMDIAQEIYFLRKRGMVSNEHWRMWMNDQMVLIAHSPSFEDVFQRAVSKGVLFGEFVEAFQPVLQGRGIEDPSAAQRTAPMGTTDSVGVERVDGTRLHEAAPTNGLAGGRARHAPGS
jgi:hypothetical protein